MGKLLSLLSNRPSFFKMEKNDTISSSRPRVLLNVLRRCKVHKNTLARMQFTLVLCDCKLVREFQQLFPMWKVSWAHEIFVSTPGNAFCFLFILGWNWEPEENKKYHSELLYLLCQFIIYKNVHLLSNTRILYNSHNLKNWITAQNKFIGISFTFCFLFSTFE